MTARRVLITGAARRIGATIARCLASDGWDVIIHYNTSRGDADALASDIRQAGGRCGLIQADLSERADIESLIPNCIDSYGALDCLINNAATFINDDISSVSWEIFHHQITANLAAPLFLSQQFGRLFGERTGGCIINMLDQKVGNLNPDFLSYTLSKVGLSGLTQVLSMAFKSRIRVCGIAPGVTLISGKQTEEGFQRAWRATPSGRSSTPEEIANCVRFILSTPSLTGQTIVLDGGESVRGRARDVAFDLGDEVV
jgi:NAD(P)-dependent dehydrogenase (short-subunit alcohol dehydrogenase family)